MSFVRITTDRALDEMKAGHEVYQLQPADLSMPIAEWLTGEFVIEEAQNGKEHGSEADTGTEEIDNGLPDDCK